MFDSWYWVQIRRIFSSLETYYGGFRSKKVAKGPFGMSHYPFPFLFHLYYRTCILNYTMSNPPNIMRQKAHKVQRLFSNSMDIWPCQKSDSIAVLRNVKISCSFSKIRISIHYCQVGYTKMYWAILKKLDLCTEGDFQWHRNRISRRLRE